MYLPDGLTLPLLVGAALIDSINPCVFGVLIFLIAFMMKVFKSPHRMLLGGLLYTIVVYLTYFLLGLGIIQFTVSFGFMVVIYWIAAIIAITAGLLEIKDYFWYGRGFTLQLFPGAGERIEFYTKKIKKLSENSTFLSYLAAAVLGIFVVIVELPCTGAPYLAILALISKGYYSQAIPLLLLYNLIFVLPLFIIIAFAYFGKSSTKMEAWRKEHRGLMRLVIGIFLLALGLYMIYTII